MKIPQILPLLTLVIFTSCQGLENNQVGWNQEKIADEVIKALRAFESAERNLSLESVTGFLDPEFRMLQDGHRVDYESTMTQMHKTLPTLQAFEPRFEDVQVLVLSPDTAVTSMIFHDVITDASGQVTRTWGPSTLVWRFRNGRWRILFGDSDHYSYPDS